MTRRFNRKAKATVSVCALCAAVLVASACSAGAPDVPSDHSGRWENDSNSLCRSCHLTGEHDAPIPPDNHFTDEDPSTETFDSGYSKCYECHDGLF